MKTYKQFVAEVALLAAPLAVPVGKAIGAGLAATGLTGMIMQARKQGEGKRSQPVDYGQGGTAKPRTKNVQRPTGKQPKASYRDRMRAKQKADRSLERQQSSDVKHGPSFEKDAAEAAKRREQNISQKPLTPDQRLDRLVGKAAKNLGIKLP